MEAFTKSEIQEHHLQSLRVVTVEMELVIQLKQELPFIMAVVVEEDHSHLMAVHLVDKVVVVLAAMIPLALLVLQILEVVEGECIMQEPQETVDLVLLWLDMNIILLIRDNIFFLINTQRIAIILNNYNLQSI